MSRKRTMLMDLGTGQTRPMRPAAPVVSSASKVWDGFFLEEFDSMASESRNVSLLDSAVFLQLEGCATLEWQGGGRSVSKKVSPGQISILPANHPYTAKLRAAGGSVVVSLEQKLLACAAATQGALGIVEPFWVHGVDDALARELVLALRVEARAERSNARYAEALASTLAAHVVSRYSVDRLRVPDRPDGLSGAALRRTVRFIQENLSQDLSIQRLAGVAGLSDFHFARMFKRSTGVSPHQYLLTCRIARAKELMLDPSLNLAEVALRAGFCDQGHLTRAFRRYVGTTPGNFARHIDRVPGE